MSEMTIWVGVMQDYDSERTELFQERRGAREWLQRQWERQKMYAALTSTYWGDIDDRSDYTPDVTDIDDRDHDGFSEFRTNTERYFIQEREVRPTNEEES